MNTPTIAAGFVAALANFAAQHGADRAALLSAGGLTETDLSNQDNRVPVSAYHAVIETAIAQTGDTALLLRHTFESDLQTISIVGQIVHSARSLAHSIEQLNRYIRLLADAPQNMAADRYQLLRTDHGLWIIDHLTTPDTDFMGVETSFARFISEFRRSFPNVFFALELEVTYSPPPHADQYPELFRIPVTFNAARNALRLDPIWGSADSEFEPGHAYAFGIFTRHADALLKDLETDTTARGLIEAQILPRLHAGSISMDRIAKDVGMSRQTLYRRLKEEGLNFAAVHDDLRKRMALDYLGAQKVTVNETAYLLGFSEASSFVRAFKRWTGKSPTAYLNQLG
ncbi:MAG: AraC family transcriptional regulator ligand-binding domain-containing protein [Sulfitobacter sp.]